MQQLYSKIYIPLAVYQEIEAGKEKVYYKDLSEIKWINISQINDKQALKYFIELDAGEAEAIILATELNADLMIIDEKLGRFHAKHADLKVTGTIGILIKAKRAGLVDKLRPLLEELIDKDVWINKKLVVEILKEVDEE